MRSCSPASFYAEPQSNGHCPLVNEKLLRRIHNLQDNFNSDDETVTPFLTVDDVDNIGDESKQKLPAIPLTPVQTVKTKLLTP